ncbi:hypothetical protein HX815_18845 [Pseudomonas sp. E6002]|uniref:hypothetical protein n=1 Tax=Pseudomonas sp. E6002 TaxID=2738820 RepID=UPI0015A00434|nr:hypothetical protein [Pseudomonas sp. E6002]NWB42375.1 hypothetical protein [Pseudomonas sp. E6002]
MPVVKLCLSCNKSLAGYRKHAQTCGSTCRGKIWRSKQEITVPVKLAFSVQNFELIRKAAEASGKSINQYVRDRFVQSEYSL